MLVVPKGPKLIDDDDVLLAGAINKLVGVTTAAVLFDD